MATIYDNTTKYRITQKRRDIFLAVELEYHRKDLLTQHPELKSLPIAVQNRILDTFNNYLSDSEVYMDAYWQCLDEAVADTLIEEGCFAESSS